MATIMSALPISVFERNDLEMRAALAAGWRRRDLWWERLQERGHQALAEGQEGSAIRSFRLAFWLSNLAFPTDDPRRAASLANTAFAARRRGAHVLADRRYAEARRRWAKVSEHLADLGIRPRARSSLFHLRMEVKHWATYRDNMKARLGKFIQETDEALAALAQHQQPPHRLFSRWRGEKPAVFDDTRKLLAACLLIASDRYQSQSRRNS